MSKIKALSPTKKLSYAQKVKSVNANRLRGDIRLVAQETNYHPCHVSDVLRGKYRNDVIVDAAYTMLRSRKAK